MNGVLRGTKPQLTEEWMPVINSAVEGMVKLSNVPKVAYEGEVYRGMNISESKVGALFNEGEEFSDAGFLSTSTSSDEAFEGNVKINIKSKSGIKVKDLSAHKEEEEVLFKPGTKFKVTKKTQDDDGAWNIDLEEKS